MKISEVLNVPVSNFVLYTFDSNVKGSKIGSYYHTDNSTLSDLGIHTGSSILAEENGSPYGMKQGTIIF